MNSHLDENGQDGFLGGLENIFTGGGDESEACKVWRGIGIAFIVILVVIIIVSLFGFGTEKVVKLPADQLKPNELAVYVIYKDPELNKPAPAPAPTDATAATTTPTTLAERFARRY